MKDRNVLIVTLTELKRVLWEEAEIDRSNGLNHRAKRKQRHASAVERVIDDLNIREHGGPQVDMPTVTHPVGPVDSPPDGERCYGRPIGNGDDLTMPNACRPLTPAES